jgi:hypothetical protein
MSSEAEQSDRVAEPELGVTGPPTNHRPPSRREPHPASRTEAKLRVQVTELETRLSEVSRCLVDAENRVAERQGAVEDLERRYAVIATSRSWRMTSGLRSAARGVRRLFRS